MVILGIDPGSVKVGYGVIKKEDGELSYLEGGLIKLPRLNYEKRLIVLEEAMEKLLKRVRPARVGLEKLFFVKNQKSAFEVAQARGVILNIISKSNVPLFEVGPNEVKLSIAGNGRAPKEAVAKMVNLFLNIGPQKVAYDISDALAIAIAVSSK